MQITNEWQLDNRLSRCINEEQRADFSLWLAMLSAAVDEMAPFFTPEVEQSQTKADLHKALAVAKARPFDWQDTDIALGKLHSDALISGGLGQLKLQSYLQPGPVVMQDNKRKLSDSVWQNLNHHARRRLTDHALQNPMADVTGLYEVLQQLHQPAENV